MTDASKEAEAPPVTPDLATAARPRKHVTINQQILFSLVGLNLLVTVLFSLAFYVKQKKAVTADLDSTLRAVATMACESLPADYHDRIAGPSSVSDSDYQKIVERNNRLCVTLGLEYIWSLMEVDGRIVFTTATSPDKVAANRKHATFFEEHSNPEIYLPAFKRMRPTYKSTHDKWGHNRIVLLPFTDAQGRKYLFGASFSLDKVDGLVRRVVWQVLGLGLSMFALSMAVGIAVTRRITRPINQLTSTIRGLAAGARDLVAEERGSYELVTLARQFNLMNRALQEKITGLETESKLAEGDLMMSEQRYRGLLNFAVDGILIGSHEGVIIEANECICVFFGLARSELIGKRINEMPFTPESMQWAPFRFDLLQNEEKVVSERTIRRADGSEIVVEMHTKMMEDGTYQSIYRDVSERKRTEEKVLTSERRYRDILNFAVDGILVCSHEGVVIEANECICGYCGMRLSELTGQSVRELPFTPESLLKQPFRIDLVEKGELVVKERTIRRRDGSEVVVEMHTKKMPDGTHQSIWYDITQRKQTEALLVETRRLLDQTQRISRVGGWAFDFTTGQAAWTEEVYRIYGVGHDVDISDPDFTFSFYAPEHAPLARTIVTDGCASGQPFDFESGFVRANGERIWVRVIGQPILENGQVVKVNGCLMDITVRKQAEEALKLKQKELARQNEVLTALLQNLKVGVVMVEAPSGKRLVANQEASRLLGKGILPDRDFHKLVEVYEAYKGSDRTRHYPVDEMPIMLGMKGVSAQVDDLVIVRPDGTESRLEIFGTPVKDERGCVWASLVSFIDITERQRVERELRDSEDRYRQLFEMESDALFLIDNETGKILDVNLSAQTLYGYGRDELLSKRNTDLSAEPEQTREATQKSAQEQPNLIRIALRRHRKSDGTVFPVEIAARGFTMDGRNVHIAAVRDITERRKAQELLESWNVALERRVADRTAVAEARMQQLQRLTGQLIRAEEGERQRISDVLHEDLQQTLVAARMTLGVAVAPIRSLVAQESINRVDEMLSRSIRLTRTLVQEIAVPGVKEADLPAAISWIAKQMLDKFGLNVALTVGDGLAPVSENIYLCLYRALQEILFNVVKHSQVRHAEVMVQQVDGQSVRLTVKDRGCGFPADEAAAERAGMGVGLYGIRERVYGLGGHMEIVGSAGEGTTVTITMPSHDGQQESV